jgi:enoyl-CoA hydratase
MEDRHDRGSGPPATEGTRREIYRKVGVNSEPPSKDHTTLAYISASVPIQTSNCVVYQVDDHVAVITIDRPEARNAVSPEVAQGIEGAIDAAEGERRSLGHDPHRDSAGVLCWRRPEDDSGRSAAELSTARGGFGGVVSRDRSKPLIAAVEGAALAGGTEIVLACDLVVAAEDARFGIPEVNRGLIAAAGGLFRLGRKIPLNLAMECALTGDPIDAPFARRHGLINALCAPGEALATALGLARRISANAPLAARESRAIVLECTSSTDEEAWRRSQAGADRAFASDDVREGVAAFLEKRSPPWTGR